jgi:hypothetical protein
LLEWKTHASDHQQLNEDAVAAGPFERKAREEGRENTTLNINRDFFFKCTGENAN